MERAVTSTLATLFVGGCGLVLDVAPSQDVDASVPTSDASTGTVDAADGGSSSSDGSVTDAGVVASDGATADAACTPARETCNAVDDNCDGVVDEWCSECSRYVLAGATGGGLAPDDPMGAIQEAIDSMALAGDVGKVCVAAATSDGGCAPTTYSESVTMAEGVSVFGGFHARPVAPWDRSDPRCETILQPTAAVGVYFGDALTEATTLDGFTVIGAFTTGDGAAITVEGGATIANADVTGDARGTSHAIDLRDCEAPVRIVGNRSIVGAGEGDAIAYAIEASGCTVTVARNGRIAGRTAGTADAFGVACRAGSQCTIDGNASIVGIDVGASGTNGHGVLLDRAGGSVVQNGSIGGCLGTATGPCSGVLVTLGPAGTTIDRNVVEPSRGRWNSGIRVVRTTATIQNNLVTVGGGAGIVLGVDPAGATEATVHSNTVVTHSSDASAPAALLAVDGEGGAVSGAEPNGIFRNNIAACLGGPAAHASFEEFGIAPPPSVLENNDFWRCEAAYRRSTGVVLTAASVAGALGSSSASNNISEDPLFVAPPSNYHLSTGSTLIDSGTSSGTVPSHDFDGEHRPRGRAPDIGFDETDVTRP